MQTSRIEEVIGDFVQLKRAGSNLNGLSPFTDEKTPSFMVSPAKQIFKCFSTGKGGTVVTFLIEKEHFSYPEALRWLANRYNIEIPEEAAPTAEEIADKNERNKGYASEALEIIKRYANEVLEFYNLTANVLEENESSIALFETAGFELVGVRKNWFYERGKRINERIYQICLKK